MTSIRALLFDLDGTLVDTAPDLCGTIHDMQQNRGVTQTPFENMQPHASGGARALLKIGFNLTPEHDAFLTYRQEFLERYESRIAKESRLFEGIDALITRIETNKLTWGVVTNKPYYLAQKLLQQLNYLNRCAILVGGDTTAEPKPSPLPCTFAAKAIQLEPAQCLMIGDDKRDIISGHKAGMKTAAVRYGYLASDVNDWNADYIFDTPYSIQNWLQNT